MWGKSCKIISLDLSTNMFQRKELARPLHKDSQNLCTRILFRGTYRIYMSGNTQKLTSRDPNIEQHRKTAFLRSLSLFFLHVPSTLKTQFWASKYEAAPLQKKMQLWVPHVCKQCFIQLPDYFGASTVMYSTICKLSQFVSPQFFGVIQESHPNKAQLPARLESC